MGRTYFCASLSHSSKLVLKTDEAQLQEESGIYLQQDSIRAITIYRRGLCSQCERVYLRLSGVFVQRRHGSEHVVTSSRRNFSVSPKLRSTGNSPLYKRGGTLMRNSKISARFNRLSHLSYCRNPEASKNFSETTGAVQCSTPKAFLYLRPS